MLASLGGQRPGRAAAQGDPDVVVRRAAGSRTTDKEGTYEEPPPRGQYARAGRTPLWWWYVSATDIFSNPRTGPGVRDNAIPAPAGADRQIKGDSLRKPSEDNEDNLVRPLTSRRVKLRRCFPRPKKNRYKKRAA